MPTYDYECRDCGPFEAFRRMADRDAPAACPRCGAVAQRLVTAGRLVSAAGATAGEEGSYRRMRHAAGCACCG